MSSQPILPIADANAPFFLGFDLGGTNVKIGLLDNQGRTLGFTSIPTLESEGPQQAVERMAQAGQKLAESLEVEMSSIPRVGLGSPGTMCLKRGILLEPPNLPHWYQFPIRDALEKATAKPVSFINDANAAAFGEFWVGTGSQFESLIMVTLGTGVGGGVICEGNLINGANSFGSECGHIIVDSTPEARLCVWGGGRGQLEAYASASAVAAQAEEGLAAGAESLLRVVAGQGKPITAKRVYDAAVQGDELALKIVDETAHYLGVGITSMVHVIDPGLVVLGGAMSFGGPGCSVGKRFLDGIIAEFRERTFANVFEGTRIEFASLGGDAGYIGAAGIAQQDYHKSKY